MKALPLFPILLFCISCSYDKPSTTTNAITSKDSIKATATPTRRINMMFLGHKINCTNEELSQEFERICRDDCNLSFDSTNGNVTIYGTTFHLNYDVHTSRIMLVSSVQPETKEIERVRKAISKYHGEGNEEEPEHYSWLPYTDSTRINKNYPIIHLRRVRSDEGGTVILLM